MRRAVAGPGRFFASDTARETEELLSHKCAICQGGAKCYVLEPNKANGPGCRFLGSRPVRKAKINVIE